MISRNVYVSKNSMDFSISQNINQMEENDAQKRPKKRKRKNTGNKERDKVKGLINLSISTYLTVNYVFINQMLKLPHKTEHCIFSFSVL